MSPATPCWWCSYIVVAMVLVSVPIVIIVLTGDWGVSALAVPNPGFAGAVPSYASGWASVSAWSSSSTVSSAWLVD